MKKIKAFLLTSTAFITFSLVSCGGDRDAQNAADQASHAGDYTLMIYMCASTLESEAVSEGYTGSATADLYEILSCNIPDNLNVVIRTGGTSLWDPYYSDKLKSNYIQTFRVKDHKLIEITSQRKQYTSKSISMSNKEELKEFVDFSKSYYPSPKNSLILWDHGGAMSGVCQDTHYSRESYPALTNSDVHYALSSFTGDNKLEFIGYDACLMAVQDVAQKNSLHAKYMVASQENEPGMGWAYDYWLPTLCNNPNTDTFTILKKIADSYVEVCDETYAYWGYEPPKTTMSVLDLDKSTTFMDSWEEAITETNISSTADFATFSNKFKNGLKFGETEKQGGGTYYPFDVFDIGEFKTNVGGAFASIDYSQYVKYKANGTYYTNHSLEPCGLNMFCPISGLNNSSIYTLANTNYENSISAYQYGNWCP